MATDSHSTGFFLRFARDGRGVSAVEFALLAPVMIAIYFGLAEFCQGFMAQQRVSHATSQIADLVAQTDVVTTDQLDDTLAIGGLILKPFSATPLKTRVSSVTRNSSGVAKVDWSRGGGLTALTAGSTVTVPAGMIANGETTIMSEATYDYVSPLRYFLPNAITFRNTYYLRPRLVEKVGCSNC